VRARPSKIVCVGRNYAGHARELGNPLPERPLLFLKPPSAIIYNGESIVLPLDSQQVEHEAEIGVVVGQRARHVAEAEAMNVVSGFLPLNDVTARDLQKIDTQFTRAKSFDTFCPLGEEVPKFKSEWQDLEIICRVNGIERQHGKATDMVFGIPALIAFITKVMTLEAGDIIATGTPEGVAQLYPGDLVEVELAGLETVQNPVVAHEAETRW
jgi:2-keto-4-pentenoate hydratase/2-oxohepta-3-ene-1,7-dioic acid hydratase in catechol pathway